MVFDEDFPTTFIITASSGPNGTILPNGEITVAKGESITFEFYPNAGCHFNPLFVDGVNIPIMFMVGEYEFTNVQIVPF